MGGIIFLFILLIVGFIRTVPANTVIIIDRNSHYLKTKKYGMFFFNPFTDKITTKISKNKIYKYYLNNFETHDGRIVNVSFNVVYHAENLEAVLDSLKSARRSVDDIMNSSIYWAVRNLSFVDFYNKIENLDIEARPKLLSESRELNIKIDNFSITNINDVTSYPNIKIFKPHLSCHSSGPIKYN